MNNCNENGKAHNISPDPKERPFIGSKTKPIVAENLPKAKRRKMEDTSSYLRRSTDLSTATIEDMDNPHTFYNLLNVNDDTVLISFLQRNKLIAQDNRICEKCAEEDKIGYMIVRKSEKPNCRLGHVFRCKTNGQHEKSLFIYSFFANCRRPIQDILVFAYSLLKEMNLKTACHDSGIDYGRTGVYWAAAIRDVMAHWVYEHIIQAPLLFSGEIEIDESLFGRKVSLFHPLKYIQEVP